MICTDRKIKLGKGEKNAEVVESNVDLQIPSEQKFIFNDPSSKSIRASNNITENNELETIWVEKDLLPIRVIHFLNFWIVYQWGFASNDMLLSHLNTVCSN